MSNYIYVHIYYLYSHSVWKYFEIIQDSYKATYNMIIKYIGFKHQQKLVFISFKNKINKKTF